MVAFPGLLHVTFGEMGNDNSHAENLFEILNIATARTVVFTCLYCTYGSLMGNERVREKTVGMVMPLFFSRCCANAGKIDLPNLSRFHLQSLHTVRQQKLFGSQ